MRCSVPSHGRPAHPGTSPRAPGRRRPAGRGYPAGVSTEQTPTDPGPRPTRLTVVAALAAVEGLALVVVGLVLAVRALLGDGELRSALTGGLTLVALGVIPLAAARGLLARRSWSRGPAIITQILALPVAWQFLQADSVLIPGGVVLAVVAISALVMLVNPATTIDLGIRPPGAER